MVVDIGEVKRHIKPKADSTLLNMRKDYLIEYIRTLEHNYNVAVSFNENQAKYIESLGVLPKWIPVTERLPEDDLPKCSKVKQIKVLTVLKSDKGVRTVRSQMRFRCTWYSDAAPWAWKYSGSEITHWMPLPEPPKEESNA